MWNCRTLFVSILCLGASSGAVLGDCGVAGLEGNDDGAWLVSLNGAWQSIDNLSAAVIDGRPRDLTFAYVAREPALANYRRGILVIKTGIRAPAAKGGDRVTLAREPFQRIEKCEVLSDLPRRYGTRKIIRRLPRL